MAEKKCRITVILPVDIYGDKGTKIRVVPNNQYCYTFKGMMDRECFAPGCGRIGSTPTLGYIIEIENENFIIWHENVMEEDHERTTPEELLPFGEYYIYHIEEELRDRDYKKTMLENTGYSVKDHERTDYNGRWLEKLLEDKTSQ